MDPFLKELQSKTEIKWACRWFYYKMQRMQCFKRCLAGLDESPLCPGLSLLCWWESCSLSPQKAPRHLALQLLREMFELFVSMRGQEVPGKRTRRSGERAFPMCPRRTPLWLPRQRQRRCLPCLGSNVSALFPLAWNALWHFLTNNTIFPLCFP